MVFSPSFPKDFKQALANTLTDQDVDAFLKKPDCSPRFVYGALMLPTILKYNIDLDQGVKIQKFMTQATLFSYQLHQYAEEGIPIIIESDNPNTAVQGMLIFNLNSEQRNAMHELESGLLRLASVQVEICQKSQHDGRHIMRKIDAGTFEWDPSWCSGTDSPNFGLQLMQGSMWDIEPFLRSSVYQHMVQSQSRTSLAMESSYATSGFRSSLYPHTVQSQRRTALAMERSSVTSGNTSNSLVEIDHPPKEDSEEEYFTPVEEMAMHCAVEDDSLL